MGLGILLVSVLSGCDGKKSSSDTTVDIEGSVGTWLEVRDDSAPSPRFVSRDPLTKNLQQLTLNSDNTFKFEIVDSKGKPSKEGGCSGTWEAQGGAILFEVTENSLDEKLKTMTPQRTLGPQGFVDPQTQKKITRLRVFDQDGGATSLEKK